MSIFRLSGVTSVPASGSTGSTQSDSTDTRKPVSEKIMNLFIKAKANVYKKYWGKSKKEALELATRDVFSVCRVMTEREETQRRDSIYNSIVNANNRGGRPALTDAQLYHIAYKSDVSGIPKHRIDMAKQEGKTGRIIDEDWWNNVAITTKTGD